MEKISENSPTQIRFPSETKLWIKENAKKNRRTISQEVIFIVEKEKALSVSPLRASNANNPNA